MLSQFVRFLTGVEIHPGATIGRRFFIDHGMGVGRSSGRDKRHPTLRDGVVIGAGAAIIGPVTAGAHSVVGANAVVVKDAPADSVLTGCRRELAPAPPTPNRSTSTPSSTFELVQPYGPSGVAFFAVRSWGHTGRS